MHNNNVAAEARLDAALAAVTVLRTNLKRLGGLPVAADTALDDIDDLIDIISAKIQRAMASLEIAA